MNLLQLLFSRLLPSALQVKFNTITIVEPHVYECEDIDVTFHYIGTSFFFPPFSPSFLILLLTLANAAYLRLRPIDSTMIPLANMILKVSKSFVSTSTSFHFLLHSSNVLFFLCIECAWSGAEDTSMAERGRALHQHHQLGRAVPLAHRRTISSDNVIFRILLYF